MITFIILVVLLIIGITLTKNFEFKGWDTLGVVLTVASGIFLIIHTVCISLKPYEYELFFAKRQAFEMTLQGARQNNNPLEAAAIVGKVAEWNQELASSKYLNSILILDQYIDDRIETLEPIK